MVIVYVGMLVDVLVSGVIGSLLLMMLWDNVMLVKFEGVVWIIDSVILILGNGVDIMFVDLMAVSWGSVWFNSNNFCVGISNCEYRVNSLLFNDGDVYLLV